MHMYILVLVYYHSIIKFMQVDLITSLLRQQILMHTIEHSPLNIPYASQITHIHSFNDKYRLYKKVCHR